ncbi:hypothetical protein AB0B60_46065 [Streptomyces lincolnensis]|uniref:hypothetical protein n=1 Tax=Streptomyces lincolnensis TaxID=1915 RepID=UPI00082C840A|nr:hypothetical protein [Streptomyces lincolnensis]
MKRLRRTCLALALALGLSLTTAGVSTAVPDAVAGCPREGTRFKSPGYGDEVFLVGPKSYLYSIPDAEVYFDLWGSWDGIETHNRDACKKSATPLRGGHLAKWDGSPNVYIWDATFPEPGYRHIENWDIFNGKYHFDPAAIRSVHWAVIEGRLLLQHPWT